MSHELRTPLNAMLGWATLLKGDSSDRSKLQRGLDAIERNATREDAVEILLQLRNGDRRAIVQAKAGETFLAGDPVILVTTDGRTRVTRAPAGMQPAPALPPPVQSSPRG